MHGECGYARKNTVKRVFWAHRGGRERFNMIRFGWTRHYMHNYPTTTRPWIQFPNYFWPGTCAGSCWESKVVFKMDFDLATSTRTSTRAQLCGELHPKLGSCWVVVHVLPCQTKADRAEPLSAASVCPKHNFYFAFRAYPHSPCTSQGPVVP